MKIYYRLMYSNPQALIELDNYQRRYYGCGISIPEETEPGIKFKYQGEDLEVMDREMRKPPRNPRQVK